MKKIILSAAIAVAALSANAQKKSDEGSFKPFKVDISGGYAVPTGGGGGSKGGVLFAIEPKYAVIPSLSVGLRIEAAVTVAGVDLATGNTTNSASAKAAASYLATGDYYFTQNDLRPFLGAGAGIFQTAAVDINSGNSSSTSGNSKFGGMVRGGIEYKHLRIGVEYNIIPKISYPESSPGAGDAFTAKNAYVGVKLGVCIGGGRR